MSLNQSLITNHRFSYIHALGRHVASVEVDGQGAQKKYYFNADYLGSVRMISDENAQVVWQKRYEPFGGSEEESGTIENTYQFTGKGWDEDAGLFYFNARWYDAEIGRFISEDPIWGSIFDPQSLNRFAYGRNNPYRYTDPTGKESFDDLNDPDGREYSYNRKTGEMRYGDSTSNGEGHGISTTGSEWSGWIDPNENSLESYQEGWEADYAQKELDDFLAGGGVLGYKPYMTKGDYANRLELEKAEWTLRATSLSTMAAGGYIMVTGGVPGVFGGAAVTAVGAFGFAVSDIFGAEIDDYYEHNYK